MDLVCSLDDLPFIGDSDVLTLVRVKVHLPLWGLGPCLCW